MKKKKHSLYDDQFWKQLIAVESLKGATSLGSFLKEHSMVREDLEKAILFLREFHHNIEIEGEGVEEKIVPPLDRKKVEVSFGLLEWVALQANFPLMNGNADYAFHKTLKQKFSLLESKHKDFNIFQKLDNERRLDILRCEHTDTSEKLKQIEYGTQKRDLLLLTLANKKLDVFPHKIVYIDGSLVLVAEDCLDRCLVSLSLNEISSVRIVAGHNYRPNYSYLEIDDFIAAIRSVSGNEERLILKVVGDNPVDLNPSYHFLGNPYVTINWEGDMIWAASVECSEELFKWLYLIKDNVEILDPLSLKSVFEEYCQLRDTDVGGKKVA